MAFNYDQVPTHYTHCFYHQCPQAESCLRHLAGVHCPDTREEVWAVNPQYAEANAGHCAQYRTTQPIRVAWGIQGLLDNVPHKQAVPLRKSLIQFFGKTLFYRFQRKEYGISAQDQKRILQLFRQHGVTQEPNYEYYTEEYDWGILPR